jgi:syntaxin 1B/2/3
LDDLIDKTSLLAADIRTRLQEINDRAKELEEEEGEIASTRIRKNMNQSLTKKFLDLMQCYQEVQTNYKNKYKEKMERQIKIGEFGGC